MRPSQATLFFAALLSVTLLALLFCVASLSGNTEAVTLEIEAPELFHGQSESVNLTITSDNDEDVHLEVYDGRMEYGGQLLDSFDISVESGKEEKVSVDIIPSLGENPLFVYGDGSVSAPFTGNVSLWAGADYSDVLLIMNNNSAISKEIGEYFLGYHDPHVLYVDTPAKETISRAEFDDVRGQIEDHLQQSGLEDSINYILTTKGVPLRVSGDGKAAFDSELTLILGQYSGDIGGSGYRYNPYYNSNIPFSRSMYDIYLVCRLTAYTVDEVKSLIDRSVNASDLEVAMELAGGQVVLDVDPGRDGGSYEVGNDWMRNAAGILEPRGYDVNLDTTTYFLRQEENVSMYASWGSNDGHDFIAHGTNSNLETDSDTDDVPDDWTYVEGGGEMTRTQEDKYSGSWSVRVIRDEDTGESSLTQEFYLESGYRYYLQGYANVTGVSGTGGVRLVIWHYDGKDNLIHESIGSVRRGTTSSWVSLGVCHLEPVEGTEYVRFGILMEDADGTAYLDQIRLVEIVPNNSYLDGAIAETIVSTGGRSFNYPTNYGQSLIADVIRSGVTGIKGYVYEPYLDAISHPDILFPRFTDGRNLAESYYAGSIKLSWMDVVIGDPKMAPFALLPDLAISEVVVSPHPKDPLDQSIFITIENTGGSRSQSWNLTIAITNGTEYWNTTTTSLPHLYPGEQFTFTMNWSAPEPGSYSVTGLIDHQSVERSAGNNNSTIVFDVPTPPDLVVRSVDVEPNIPNHLNVFTLEISVFNDGESSANGCNLTLFVDGEYLTSQLFDAEGTQITFVDLELSLPWGDHNFTIIVDSDELFEESNETNNWFNFTMHVNALPVAVGLDPIWTRVGVPVVFNASNSYDPDGNITIYSWNVDGDLLYGRNVTHSFDKRGNITVILTVVDDSGAVAQTGIMVNVGNSPPVAVFQLPEFLMSLEDYTFDGRNSYDNDTDFLTFHWDFGDGTTHDTAIKKKSFGSPGAYDITLTVTDILGSNSSTTRSVTIENRLPDLQFEFSYRDTVYPGPSITGIQFISHAPIIINLSKSQDSDGSIALFNVDFGDGTIHSGSASPVIEHSYPVSGSYQITMMITDDFGGATSSNYSITIMNEPPQPSFTWQPDEPYSFELTHFNSTSTDNGEIVYYAWEINGIMVFSSNISHSFSTYGFHDLLLVVRDDEGAEANISQRVYVQDIPAEITGTDQYAKVGTSVRITWSAEDRDGAISHYTVRFPDGSKEEARKQYLDHTFTKPGTYVLNITVVDDMGLSNSVEFTVMVEEGDEESFISIPIWITIGALVIAMIVPIAHLRKKY